MPAPTGAPARERVTTTPIAPGTAAVGALLALRVSDLSERADLNTDGGHINGHDTFQHVLSCAPSADTRCCRSTAPGSISFVEAASAQLSGNSNWLGRIEPRLHENWHALTDIELGRHRDVVSKAHLG